MTNSKVIVHILRSGLFGDEQTVCISESLIKKWNIPHNQSVNFRFGAFKTYVRVIPINRSGQLRMSESLVEKMGVRPGAPLRVAYRPGSQSIQVGPLIGVIVSRAFPQEPDRPFGNITAFCRELVDASLQQGAFVYFFPPGGIGTSHGTVEGWTYAGGWRKGVFPAPDVLHNRLTTRKLENHPKVQKFFKETKSRYGTSIFNEKYLDKTEVFAALRKDASLHALLPESHPYSGVDTLKSMCAKYRTVFLKPIRGSLGKGIIRVTKTETGTFACHFSELNGTRKVVFPSLAKLHSTVAPRLKMQKFQIQQGLTIAYVGGRPVDFRALVQKGLSGAWDVTSIVGRIAGPNHFVSNLAKGGTIIQAKQAILKSNIPSGRRTVALAALRTAALTIAKGVESTINAHFGELGVDLALDRSGKVWLLEVNSKPSKNDNTQLSEGKIRPSVKLLVQYARHLTKL
ncbi:YheC/YheD family endospore coat-associated protein [Paenibacillus alkalitolerans]|uniref:YheC/YheD family endospore coat-associated protein n=1 Tax=Paenibacillus alkalitolerans TaxID=2799335 RepID=UPI0018F7C004|nr:YheC/YheD family protein [Paenibacillus alkalitolerans]